MGEKGKRNNQGGGGEWGYLFFLVEGDWPLNLP